MAGTVYGRGFRVYPFYYAVFWALSASINQYLGLYYEFRGLSGVEIGSTSSINSLSGIFFALIVGRLIDIKGKAKPILFLISCIGLASALLMRFSSSFIMIVFSAAGLACCLSPPGAVVDEQLVRRLGDHSKMYSVFRMWGPAGFAISSLVSSFAISKFGILIIFPIFSCFCLLLMAIYAMLPEDTERKENCKRTISLKDVYALLGIKGFRFSLFMLFLWGICESGMFQFVNIFLVASGYDVSLTGLFSAVAMIGEFFAYVVVCKAMRSHRLSSLMTFAFIFVGLEYAGFIWSKNVFLLIVLRLLGGAGFPFVWSTATEIISKSVPVSLSVTAQECKSVALSGLGYVCGLMLCGFFYDYAGLTAAFVTIFTVSLAGLFSSIVFKSSVDGNIIHLS